MPNDGRLERLRARSHFFAGPLFRDSRLLPSSVCPHPHPLNTPQSWVTDHDMPRHKQPVHHLAPPHQILPSLPNPLHARHLHRDHLRRHLLRIRLQCLRILRMDGGDRLLVVCGLCVIQVRRLHPHHHGSVLTLPAVFSL